jgi:hypothetical protein
VRLATLGLMATVVGGSWWLARQPQPGAMAETEITRIPLARAEFTGSIPGKPGQPDAKKPPEKPVTSAADMEDEAGVKVVRGRGGQAPASVVIRVPDDNRVRLAAAPDKRVAENSPNGVLPRIGADGARPSGIYARPAAVEPPNRQRPRIAVVIGGFGVHRQHSSDAMARLPGVVTLAFAPYGEQLAAQVAKARGDGHEVVLQLPMEPVDYPSNDPGPHTLTTGAGADENVKRLRWLMSRFPGYVGVTNFLGAKFTASEDALQPVLKEVAERGLVFLDDGSSERSMALDLAARLRLDSVRASLVLDGQASARAIDAALARLEEIARRDGIAIGTATALPLSVDRIARWAEAAKGRGITLVPLSAAVAALRAN